MTHYKEDYLVSIPDKKFREILRRKYGLSFELNNKIYYGQIKYLRDLEVSNSQISTLSGIEYFTSLQILSCGGNILTQLDVSKNSELEKLNCPENKLTELDVSKNDNLQVLVCNSNNINSINVSQNSKLRSLYCETNIDVQY